MVARLGGDEFAIVQMRSHGRPTPPSSGRPHHRGDRAAPFDIDGHQVVVGASIGIAMAPSDGSEPDQLLRNADMALYRAKAEGRGTYHFFEPEMDAQHAGAARARARPAQGARQRRIRAVLPAADRPRASDEISGFEALLRWHHPERGMIAPGRIHSGRRGDRPDRADRRMGAAAGLPRRRRLARQAQGRGQSVAGAVPQSATLAQSVLSALAASGLAAIAARTGNHRNGAAAGQPTPISRRCTSCASSACASRWTISAPAIPRSAICAASRSTRSRSTAPSSASCGKQDDCVAIIRAVTGSAAASA